MTEKRPPVVAVLGHIDHGKSTLLDYIRKTNVTEKEAGGITQHVSAYEVEVTREDRSPAKITFLDTPGHEAFQGIRARGAKAADIAILVVSAEDGVKPQTLEAYEDIKASETPFIVAITKVDKPSANVDMAKQTLAEKGIYVEGYGGDVPFVPVSAKSGQGVDELLNMILLLSDIENFSGETDELGSGVIIESSLDPKKGISAVGIIKSGVVRRGLFAAAPGAVAPLRFLLDFAGNQSEELTFSSPIQIVGWSELPAAGSPFKTFLKKDEALDYAENEKKKERVSVPAQTAKEGVSNLPIILKADTAGSLEAIIGELGKLSRERIVPQVILSGVGTVAESDIKLALASPGAAVFGFHTKVDSNAASLAERSDISIETFNIIYELTDRIKALLEEREPRIEVEEVLGSAKVLKLFSATKDKQVIGARVTAGEIRMGAQLKIKRRESEVGRGKVRELQIARQNTENVTEGSEFGAMVESRLEIAPGDVLEAFTLVTK